jgi:hypothetical protein
MKAKSGALEVKLDQEQAHESQIGALEAKLNWKPVKVSESQ